jgi:hypothetical protein
MLRISHYLDSRLTDGGKVVSLTYRPPSTPQKHFSAPGTHFCYRLSKPQGLVRLEGLGKMKEKSVTSSGRELAIFRLEAWCLNHHAPRPLEDRGAEMESRKNDIFLFSS